MTTVDEKTGMIQKITTGAFDATQEQLEAALTALSRKQFHRRLGSAREAAAILGIHPETCKRYGRQGLLHPIRFTKRKMRFDLDEVEMLANHGVGNEPSKPSLS